MRTLGQPSGQVPDGASHGSADDTSDPAKVPGPRQPEGKDGARERRPGGAATAPHLPPQPPKGRRTRVRGRLVIAVAVVAAAVLGAGAPGLVAATGDVHESQDLVDRSGVAQQAIGLAQSLADERDEVTAYIAAGRPKNKGLSTQRSARVDRGVQELDAADIPRDLRDVLEAVSGLRRQSLTGKGTALAAHTSYSQTVARLHQVAAELADRVPYRAGAGAHAPVDLDEAVEQAGIARGLLLAAFAVPRSSETRTVIDPMTGLARTVPVRDAEADKQRDALSAEAQQAQVREQASLAAFLEGAPKSERSSYESTVTGTDADTADKYLKTLTDQPKLSDGDLGIDRAKLDSALTARLDLMRGVDSSLAAHRTGRLEALRDDDVTALELRVALAGVLLLVAVGLSMGTARSLTRPLAALRLGAARVAAEPATEEPVRFSGRNDEFAQVVHSVNLLHAHILELGERITTLEGDRKHLIGQRQSMAEERETLRAGLTDAAEQLELARGSIHGTFVNLALRTLGLVERQLTVIEGLEEREQDPDRLATLFKLDHFATVMRRHSENLLVLAGADHSLQHPGPVPLVDVLRAAVSEIERYERVRIAALPPHAHIAGFAADDLSHLVAELLENASSFSPPDAQVEVSAWLLESGEVVLSVQDEGIGMAEQRLEEVNELLSAFHPDDTFQQEGAEGGLGLGLYVVARLASRHGIRVRLREQKQGGVAAVVVLPAPILAGPAAGLVAPRGGGQVPGEAPTVALPGSEAEANSNVLPGRGTPLDRATAPSPGPAGDPVVRQQARPDHDPLIAAAEQTVRETETAETAESAGKTEASGTVDTATGQAAESQPSQPAKAAEGVKPAEPSKAAKPAKPGSAPGVAPTPVVETPAESTMVLHLPPYPDGEEPATAAAAPVGDPEAPATATPTVPAQAGSHGPDPYAVGPDAHDRAPDAHVPAGPVPARASAPDLVPDPVPDRVPDTAEAEAAAAERVEQWDRVTDKGLPKRTPKISAPAPAPRPSAGGVDAEALRRRLGGFHQGAKKGRHDVEAAIAEETASGTASDGASDAATGAESGTTRPTGNARPPHAATEAAPTSAAAERDAEAAGRPSSARTDSGPEATTEGDPVEEARS